MLKPIKLATLAILAAFVSGQVLAEDKPAATVDGMAIPQARMDLLLKGATAQGQDRLPRRFKDCLSACRSQSGLWWRDS